MKKVAVVTDSNSGITQQEGKTLGIRVLPMPFYINGELFHEDINMTQEQFYAHLSADAEISTSQPAPGEVTDLWDEVLSEYDELVYIPMSSGLSGACDTAKMLAASYEGKVYVVDNQRISVTQRQSVLDALELVRQGKSATKICKKLEEMKLDASIYITVDTLKYLKKGGRITPLAAAVGSLLNIKPVLQIQGQKLDAYSKVRGKSAAKKVMLRAVGKDLEDRFSEAVQKGRAKIALAYTGNYDEAQEWLKEVGEVFPEYELYMAPLSLSVSCHIGQGALAIVAMDSIEKK